jgi:hypothetical protein
VKNHTICCRGCRCCFSWVWGVPDGLRPRDSCIWTGRCAMIYFRVCGLCRFSLINHACMVFGSGFPY